MNEKSELETFVKGCAVSLGILLVIESPIFIGLVSILIPAVLLFFLIASHMNDR